LGRNAANTFGVDVADRDEVLETVAGLAIVRPEYLHSYIFAVECSVCLAEFVEQGGV
jgi:hypothetical protein